MILNLLQGIIIDIRFSAEVGKTIERVMQMRLQKDGQSQPIEGQAASVDTATATAMGPTSPRLDKTVASEEETERAASEPELACWRSRERWLALNGARVVEGTRR